MRVPPDPVPSPRPGADDEGGQIPRPRTVADANAPVVGAGSGSDPETLATWPGPEVSAINPTRDEVPDGPTRDDDPTGDVPDDGPAAGDVPDDARTRDDVPDAEPATAPKAPLAADELPVQRGVGTSRATPQSSPAPEAIATPRPAPDDEADPATAILGDPRSAPDDEPVPQSQPAARPSPTPVTRVYADGSALAQFVEGSSCHVEWLEWTKHHEADLVTTPLGLTELRRFALPAGVEARGVAREVEQRITVIRFSDQTLRAATKVSGVLPPFTALHIGAALAHSDVVAVATYETQLARVAALHGLMVVSPGLAPFWWERDD